MTNPNNGLVGLWVLLPPDPDIEEYGQITAAIGDRYHLVKVGESEFTRLVTDKSLCSINVNFFDSEAEAKQEWTRLK